MKSAETLLWLALSLIYLSGFVWAMVWSEGSRDHLAFKLLLAVLWPALLIVVMVEIMVGGPDDSVGD